MRIAIASDAWSPQVNGVVNTLQRTREQLIAGGHEVLMITPEGRRTFPCPTYPEIRLAIFQGRKIARELAAFRPNCIHIATEGTIGFAIALRIDRQACRNHALSRSWSRATHQFLSHFVRIDYDQAENLAPQTVK